MAISEACKETIYLKRNLLQELIENLYCINLFNGNQSAQKLSANPIYYKRSKHIDVRYHFIREFLILVKVEYLSSANMSANILTKRLNSEKHYKFLYNMLGVSIMQHLR